MDAVRKLILRRVEERGINLSALSRRLGKNHAYMQQFIHRGVPRKLPEDVRSKLAGALDLDEGLLGGPMNTKAEKHNLTDGRFVLVRERNVSASAGGGAVIEEEQERAAVEHWPFPRSYIETVLSVSAHKLSVIEVRGDSMEPTLRSGDKILIDHADTDVAQPGVFALYDGSSTVVKRLEKVTGTDPLQLMLISDNSLHGRYAVMAEQVHIAGRVVWFGRRL